MLNFIHLYTGAVLSSSFYSLLNERCYMKTSEMSEMSVYLTNTASNPFHL